MRFLPWYEVFFDTHGVDFTLIPSARGALAGFVFGADAKQVRCRYAISYVSAEQTAANLKAGIPDWNAERLAAAGNLIYCQPNRAT